MLLKKAAIISYAISLVALEKREKYSIEICI